MLDPRTYEFPSEAEVFTRPFYTARAKAITAKADAERRKITGRGIALGFVSFLSILALLAAAHSGLTRAERVYQQQARV